MDENPDRQEQQQFNHKQSEVDLSSENLTNHEPQMIADNHREDEEIASELTPRQDHISRENIAEDSDMGIKANSVAGWIAIALVIVSFFMMPVILAGAGIILGFVAKRNNANWIGNIAIGAGIFSLIISLFIIPFV